MASVIRLDPLATLERLAPTFLAPYKNASDRDHLRENLVKAGLPIARLEPHPMEEPDSGVGFQYGGPLWVRSRHRISDAQGPLGARTGSLLR